MEKIINKKNIYWFLILGFITLIIFLYSQKDISTTYSAPETIQNEESTSLPQRLLIPKIAVAAEVEEVGITEEGNMEVPEILQNVGWYKFGAIPGAKGNAVFAGHLDDSLRQPLVFWRLDELVVGDDIYILNEEGEELHFKVTGKELYDYNSFETEDIFGPTDERHLNLITCTGTWLEDLQVYDKRLVIFAEIS